MRNLLVASLVAATCAAGCSAPTQKPTAPERQTASDTYAIDSWQNWGRAGKEWIGKCEESGWGCINDQAGDLITAAKPLPQPTGNAATALRAAQVFRDSYLEYVNCGECADKELDLSIRKQVLLGALGLTHDG